MLRLRLPSSETVAQPLRTRCQRSVKVAAFVRDEQSPFAGLMRIFTPAKYIDSKEDWTGTETGFKGDRMRSSKSRKPFKDGYSGVNAPRSKQAVTRNDPSADVPRPGNFLQYLAEAAQRVVSNNFTGEETEPDWSKLGSRGWSKDVRRGRRKN